MTKKIGKNLKYLRRNNRNAILEFLAVNGEGSRMELSNHLGLSKMTISNIATELIGEGYLKEEKFNKKEMTATVGPKPMMLSIRKNRILAIGVYFSDELIICALTDIMHGEIQVQEEKVKQKTALEATINQIVVAIKKILSFDRKINENIVGIGFSTVGLVDSKRGKIVNSTDFLKNHGFDIKSQLEEQFSYPVFVSNHMEATAMREQLYGHGKKHKDFVYIGISNAVGSAVVIDGKVMKGSNDFAVEVGHMSVNYKGELCSCGNRGCLELYVGIPALLKKTDSLTVAEILYKINKGDEKTIEVMEEFVNIMGISLANIANIFNPSCIIIGDEGAVLAEIELDRIKILVKQFSIKKAKSQLQIVVSSFKNLEVIRGSASLVFKKLFEGQII